jgi:peptidyl-tRNA hydrolase, PTH1 family
MLLDTTPETALPYLIVGLGNPGAEYAHTRHNIGFKVLDALAEQSHTGFTVQKKLKSAVASVTVAGLTSKCIVAKPQTFMNLSGEAVRALRQFYKLPLSNVLVVYDDTALPLGNYA